MAKLKLAPFIQAISGRMGGIVYRSTKFGTEMAEFEAPSNPETPAQVAVRTAFTKSAKQWPTLTAAQVAAWNAYGKGQINEEEITEETYTSEGFNAFLKLASKWYAVNSTGSAPTTPPTTGFNGDNITVSATSEAAGTIQFSATAANGTNVTTALLVQKLKNPTNKPRKGAFKVAKYNKFTAGVGLSTTVSVAPGYYAVGYQFVNTATGQMTSPVFQAAVIGPVGFTVSSSDTKKKAA